jgi:hypothetical protein
MQILIVDCFSKNSQKYFSIFRDLIINSFKEREKLLLSKVNSVIRRLDDLDDFTCQWEYDLLAEKARHRMINFDKFDFIFLCGDTRYLPWDPLYMRVITLLQMAVHTRKVSTKII